MKLYKFKHKESGLFLKKSKFNYASVYSLSEKGTSWKTNALGTLSLTKDPFLYGFDAPKFNTDEFEIVIFTLTENKIKP